jgi:hypothetical protein
MEQQTGGPPTAEELQAFSLGKCLSPRAEQIEAFLADGLDQTGILEAAEDDLLRHLRGAGVEPGLGPEAGPLLNHPRYRLVRKLGEGGMGTVYLAEHRLLRRLVAVKLIRTGRLRSSHLVARFLRKCGRRPNSPIRTWSPSTTPTWPAIRRSSSWSTSRESRWTGG